LVYKSQRVKRGDPKEIDSGGALWGSQKVGFRKGGDSKRYAVGDDPI
jgi:hypothetical protein